MPRRRIGHTDVEVTPIAMGCWPITGITSVDVTEERSLATLEAAVDAGITFFDTAYMYGHDGESERMIARALGPVRERIAIATKAGWGWHAEPGPDGRRTHFKDGRPETIERHCEESLRRLNTDRVELLYHHAPDPNVPVAESAGAFRELLEASKTRAIGVSNYTVAELEEFTAVCPIEAVQPHYNMLQREIEEDVVPWCVQRGISVMVYWPLMKGFLAGKLSRDHAWDERDGRQKYPMFQGEQWRRNHDFLDALRPIAAEVGCTLPQLVVNWTVHRPGITCALVGAKRPEQIRETAAALDFELTREHLDRIDAAIADRGPVVTTSAR